MILICEVTEVDNGGGIDEVDEGCTEGIPGLGFIGATARPESEAESGTEIGSGTDVDKLWSFPSSGLGIPGIGFNTDVGETVEPRPESDPVISVIGLCQL